MLFPDITLHLLTLTSNFKVPVFRDVILALGICSCAKKSFKDILGKGPGHSIAIVVGGAQESLHTRPNTLDLVLKKRLGFIKSAINFRAQVVPVLSFGENEVYDMFVADEGSVGQKVQLKVKQTFGWTIPFFLGRGVFNYSMGLLPHRRRIVTVVGRAINPQDIVGVIDVDSISEQELDNHAKKVQKVYIDQIQQIWEKYKDIYAENRLQELQIIE